MAATASEPLSLVCGNIFYMAPEMIAETGLVAMTSHIMVVFVHEDWGCDFSCAPVMVPSWTYGLLVLYAALFSLELCHLEGNECAWPHTM